VRELHPGAAGFAGVTAACEPTGRRWRGVGPVCLGLVRFEAAVPGHSATRIGV
jgi:hypothetical protein